MVTPNWGKVVPPRSRQGDDGGNNSGQASASITITGCQSELLGPHLRGTFAHHGDNHGKPVYQRQPAPGSQVTTLIYYWDERDGDAVHGWWMGPKVGGDEVWAFNSNRASATPPATGWQVPWDAAVDATMQLTFSGGGPSKGHTATAGAIKVVLPRKGKGEQVQPAMQQAGGNDWNDWHQVGGNDWQQAGGNDWNNWQQAGGNDWNDPAQAEDWEQQQQQKREEARKEELARKAKEAEEEKRREALKADQKRRKEEEETRRQEQAAALLVRKTIAKVKMATPDSFDDLLQELEKLQLENLATMGALADKVCSEAEKAILLAQERVSHAIGQREAADKKKHERDGSKNEDSSKNSKLFIEELIGTTKAAESKVAAATDTIRPSALEGIPWETLAPNEVEEAAKVTAKAAAAAKEALDAASKLLAQKSAKMGRGEESEEILRSEIQPLFKRLAAGRRSLASLLELQKVAKDRASRKAAALKRLDRQKEHFSKFDADGDGYLNRTEVAALAEAEYGFKPRAEQLDSIFIDLGVIDGGVALEDFTRLLSMVDTARSEFAELERKAAEEAQEKEKEAQLQARKDNTRKAVSEVAESLDEAAAALQKTDVVLGKANPLKRADKNAIAEDVLQKLLAACAEADEGLSVATTMLEKAADRSAACNQLASDLANEDPEIRGLVGRDLLKHKSRLMMLQAKLTTASQKAQSLRTTAVRQEFNGVNTLWVSAAVAVCERLTSPKSGSISAEELFSQACKLGETSNEMLTRDAFQKLVKSLPGIGGPQEDEDVSIVEDDVSIVQTKWSDKEFEKLFCHLAGGADKLISKGKFLQLTKLYYKVVKVTLLSEGEAISSKMVKRLEDGEILELLEGPKKAADSGLVRARCRRLAETEEGWATILGSQGSAFLEPVGRFIVCNKETPLLKGPPPAAELRPVKPGEALEVLARERLHIKVQAVAGGAVGWLEQNGSASFQSQGSAFQELS